MAKKTEARETEAVVPPRYEVQRPWPGVHSGQLVDLRPERAKRLVRGGFVVEVRG